MKTYSLVLLLIFISYSATAQSLLGAWESTYTDTNGKKIKSVVIFAEGYQALSMYNADTGEFISTNGGTWEVQDGKLIEKIEFSTDQPERVGTIISARIELTKQRFKLPDNNMDFKRIDDGSPGSLQGAWLMSGRVVDGKTQNRDTSGPRKTMKILSGTRFQWIAYNTETKKFSGTGGGTYTTVNGKYTEKIEFFSRDNSRVGANLAFDFKLEDGKWHHSGLSSKGAPLYEIWSQRE